MQAFKLSTFVIIIQQLFKISKIKLRQKNSLASVVKSCLVLYH